MKSNFLASNKPLISILVLTLMVFWPALDASILPFFDDYSQILQNKNVLHFSLENIKNIFSSYVLHSYQPLATLSYAIEYFFFDKEPFIYHLNNLLIHLMNVVLVYLILSKIIKERRNAVLLMTLIFAIHPLQAETVSWLSTRSTLLFSLFFFSSCYYYIKYLESKDFSLKLFLFSLGFFLLSLFSKSMAVVLPFIIIGLDYVYERKITIKTIVEKLAFFTLSIVFGIISLYSRETIGGYLEEKMRKGRGVAPYTFIEKLQLSSDSILFYIHKFFLPIDLYGIYGYPLKPDGIELPLSYKLAPFLLLFIGAILVYAYLKSTKKYKRLLLFGLTLFFIPIALTLSVFNFLAQITAERYMYLGVIGLSIPLILFLEKIREKRQLQIGILYIVVFIFCCFKTNSLTKTWKTHITRFEFIADEFEKNDLTNNSANLMLIEIGTKYTLAKQFNSAIKCLDRAIKMNEYTAEAYAIRGVAYHSLGNHREALRNFNTVLNSQKLRANKKTLAEVFRFKSELFMSVNKKEQSLIYKDSAVYYNKVYLLEESKKTLK